MSMVQEHADHEQKITKKCKNTEALCETERTYLQVAEHSKKAFMEHAKSKCLPSHTLTPWETEEDPEIKLLHVRPKSAKGRTRLSLACLGNEFIPGDSMPQNNRPVAAARSTENRNPGKADSGYNISTQTGTLCKKRDAEFSQYQQTHLDKKRGNKHVPSLSRGSSSKSESQSLPAAKPAPLVPPSIPSTLNRYRILPSIGHHNTAPGTDITIQRPSEIKNYSTKTKHTGLTTHPIPHP